MRGMKTNTPKKDDKLVITGRDILLAGGAGGPIQVAGRCGPWGGKGRKREEKRRAIAEQS